jgi:hypothetical protein
MIILEHRKAIEGMIDWTVDVTKIYKDDNIGMDAIMDLTYERVFEHEDRMIFLEEDIYPSLSFFLFCEDLLEKYKDDERVYLIGGMNGLGEYPNYSTQNPSYFFVETCSTWGMAIWRRTYLKFQKDFSILKNEYYNHAIRRLMEKRKKFHDYQRVRFIIDNPDVSITKGELFLMGFNQNILYNSVSIVPSKNLVLNLGNSEGAEHSDAPRLLPKSMRGFEKMKLYDLEFPLIHPEYLIVDHYTQSLSKKTNIIVRMVVKVERGLRILFFGGPKRFWVKLKKFTIRYWTIERKERKYK